MYFLYRGKFNYLNSNGFYILQKFDTCMYLCLQHINYYTFFNSGVNGQWSGWSGFSLCSTTCGPGAQIRKRTCTQPPPSNGGSSCRGDKTESVQCQINPCPGIKIFLNL